jgi:hypothetical protein
MNYCNNCGVELDNSMNSCPLCGLKVGEKPVIQDKPGPKRPDYKDKVLNEIENLTDAQRRKLFWQISGIILGSGIVVTLLINLIVSKNISWAKYNIVASLAAFANISVITLWRRRPILLIIIASAVSLILMLLLLDLVSFNIGWGAKLGVPILISFYVLMLIVLLLIRISNQLGFNILAIMFIAAGLFLMCVEAFISLYFQNKITFSWSIIAATSMIPVAAILLFVHFKLRKGIELKRFFHI